MRKGRIHRVSLATLIPSSSLSFYPQCGTRVSISLGDIRHLWEVCTPLQTTRGLWAPILALALSLSSPLVPEWGIETMPALEAAPPKGTPLRTSCRAG